MRRLAWAGAWVVGVLAARAAPAATVGVTLAERHLAIELSTRLKEAKAPSRLVGPMARAYMARAYHLDVDPAADLAKDLLRRDLELADRDRLRYFIHGADALLRGARLQDVKSIFTRTSQASYGRQDRAYYTERRLRWSSRYASPVPILDMMDAASKNGMVGRRLRDFFTWTIEQVRRGENPVYIQRLYEAVSRVTPSPRSQHDFLAKCYDAVRAGAPPDRLADAMARLGKQYEVFSKLEDGLARIRRLYAAGRSFDAAIDTVVPPPVKKPGAP